MDNKTIPEVFIIESLSFENENGKLFEGKIISDILHLSGKKSIYFYIRTKNELEEVLDIFWDSKYRYLHISCHGNKKNMFTTLDTLNFEEVSGLFEHVLQNRRLFLSACSMTNNELAKAIIPPSECLSVIGPAIDVNFNDAAILWSAFYHLMFKQNNRAMKRNALLENLKQMAQIFKVPLNYFSKNSRRKDGYSYTKINTTEK